MRAAALAPVPLERLEALGLLRRASGGVEATIRLVPFEELVFACDLFEMEDEEDTASSSRRSTRRRSASTCSPSAARRARARPRHRPGLPGAARRRSTPGTSSAPTSTTARSTTRP